MRVRVDAAITFPVGEVSAKVVERLRLALTFPNPAYLERVRMGLSVGVEPETLCLLEERDGVVRIPRGAIHALKRAAAASAVAVACEDARGFPSAPIERPRELPLREYQARAVDKLARVTQGTVVIPCGGGKTRVGMGAIARLRSPTLILVHTLDLAEQWLAELRDNLGIEAGLIGDGTEQVAPVTVAIVQALVRWDPKKLDAFLAAFGLMIVDEAHHTPANTFRQVIDRCPAKYRLGLTATPEREDGLTPLLELFLGERLVLVSHDELVAAGVLAVPEIRSIESGFDFPYESAADFAPMLAALAADEARNALIADRVAEQAIAGHTCLVLSGRVDHCELLAAAIVERGAQAVVLTGRVGRKRRAALLDGARSGNVPVLVATSLADEGLDLPRLSRVFLAFPSRARGRTAQRLGRLMRPHPDKPDAVLFDFVDRKVPILRRQHLERRKLYAEVLGLPASRLRTERAEGGALA